MKQALPILTLTWVATGAIVAQRFVHVAGDQAAAGENTLGVARSAAASGEKFPVDVLGTVTVEAGGSFSKGDSLKVDADGKAIVWASSGAKVAIALEDGASGQLVEVLLIPNIA